MKRFEESVRGHLIDDAPASQPDRVAGMDGEWWRAGLRILFAAAVVMLSAIAALVLSCATRGGSTP